jgi:predicted anti-sigma-YlaC factor YlaD
MVVEISCEEVWREISDYLEGVTSKKLRGRMEEHFKGCKHCTAVLDGTRNVVQLVGDATAFELPAGFSNRLYQKLNHKLSKGRS